MEDDMIDDAASASDEEEVVLSGEGEDSEGFTDLEDVPERTEGKKTSHYKPPTAEEMERLRREEEERGGHFGFAMKVCSSSLSLPPARTADLGLRSTPYSHQHSSTRSPPTHARRTPLLQRQPL